MSKITELGPITGANTRTEDLFVIVNLIQGDDGTKNLTRAELVQAIQYEIFDRITITGGTISGVTMSDSVINTTQINDSAINRGTMQQTVISNVTILTATANNISMNASTILNSDFSDGTGNNDVFTYSTIDNSTFNDGQGNNMVFTNSRIDNSEYNNVTIDQGTANGLILTNISIDELILEDATISNSSIVTTDFSEGTISNSSIFNVDLDDVDITNSRFSNGQIWDTAIANSTILNTDFSDGTGNNNVFTSTILQGRIIDSTANNVTMTSSSITGGFINSVNITDSDFSDGTGSNNVFTDTTIQDGTLDNNVITNSSFQGVMDNVTASNMTITSSETKGMAISDKSSFIDGSIQDSEVSNTTIDSSTLVDFDMELHKVWQPNMDEDNYFAIKNVKTNETQQISYRQFFDEISKSTEKALKVHVAVDGDDNNPGTILRPVQTLKRGAELAVEKAGGVYNRNALNEAVHISVGPGTYYVDDPIELPDDCSMTSTAGQYATVIQKKPGFERTNGVLVGSGCYVQGFAYMNFEVDNFDYPEGGFAVAYRPGALLRRSPYIRDSSQLSNFNRLDVEPPLNPFNSKGTIADLGQEFFMQPGHSIESLFAEGDYITFSSGASGYVSWTTSVTSDSAIYVRNLVGNVEPGDMLYSESGGTGQVASVGIDDFPNRLVGRGGGCMLADRRVLDPDSLFTYVLCFGFTPRTQNGMGYVARDGAGVNGIGSLSIFVRTAFYALNGGQMTLNNSGTQFGDISMRAKGSTEVFTPSSTDEAILFSNTVFADTLMDNKQDIIEDMVGYLTTPVSQGGLGYQGYDAEKCKRDTGIIIDSVGYDVALNTNYWGRLNGIAYSSPISYVVKNEQLTETLGANEHLKSEINRLFSNSEAAVNTRANVSLDETLNILENGESYASDLFFTDTGNVARTAAREIIQDNRELIIDGMVEWIDNNDEFFSYDSAKCRRDIQEYILPAVKWDSMLDTNYNSVVAGQAYYSKQGQTVVENQREETVGSFERLRKITDDLVEANSAIMAERSYDRMSTIIDILDNTRTQKFNPTKATYEPDTGRMVITIGAHTLQKGQFVTIADEAFTFTCDSDGNKLEISHPRKSDTFNYRRAIPIDEVSAKTITINAGTTGANFAHTFVSAKPSSVSVLGEALTFSDDAGIPADKRNARKQLQANKEFIQDYMEGWAENQWYFYDSKKCERDTKEYIMPAVQRDLLLGTNFNAYQTGIAYRSKSGEVSVTKQLEQTVASINHMKSETANTVTGNTLAVDRVNTSFDQMVALLNNNGKKYTPTDAAYNPVTGVVEITIGAHDFAVGDKIRIEKNSMVFTCALDGNTSQHAYPSTTFETWTPSTATYVPSTGEFTVTISANQLKAGDTVTFKPGAITFTCELDDNVTEHAAPESHHPFFNKPVTIDEVNGFVLKMNVGAVTDGGGVHTFVSALADGLTTERQHPAYENPVEISARTATTITVNVGKSQDTSAHTFVSATTNAIREDGMWTGKYTPQDVTYDPVNGEMVVTIGQHDLPVGQWISIAPESIVFSCDVGGVVGTDPAPLPGHPAYNQPVRITETTSTTFTVNVGNANGHANTHTFVSATKDCIDGHALYFTDPAKFVKAYTPTNATYDPNTGDMVVTIPGHDIEVGDNVQTKPLSFAFSCGFNGGGTDYHPRIGEPMYEHPQEVTAADATTITFNAGSAGGYTGAHTFVSAEEGSIIKVSSSEKGKYAARQLQKNKTFIQEEITAWLNDNYFIYDKEKCMRDTGYILNAVMRDVLTGSNNNAVYTGLGYRIGTVGANNVVNNQLTETVGAITWLKGKINTDVLTDATAIARSDAAFDEIIDIMSNGNAAADAIDFGIQSISEDAFAARHILQLNKSFIQKEAIAWITANHPGFVYDTVACERDLGIFVDTVSWDVQHGSTASTVNNSRLYFENALPVLADDEIVPTSEVYDHIAKIAGQIVRGEEVDNLQSVVTQVKTDEDTYTPTTATYDPVTGIMVATIGTHNFVIGDRITIDPESITFSCGFGGGGTDSHPNAADPNLRKQFIITAADATTITVNAGSANGYTGAHTFVSADADCIRRANVAEAYTATDVAYAHMTGVMEVTLGDRHRFSVGDYVIFDENAITLSCPTSPTDPTPINISHPRPTDPIFNKPVRIDAVTSTTITMQVGDAKVDKVHTFVSATANGIRRSLAPTVSSSVVNLFDGVGQTIRNNDGTVPTVIEPKPTSAYGTTIISEARLIGGSKPKYQTEIIDLIAVTYSGLAYNEAKCYRDIGYIVDAITEDLEYGGDAATVHSANYYFLGAVNTLPPEQRGPTRLAYQHLADVIDEVSRAITVTATTGNVRVQDTTSIPAADVATGSRAHDLVEIIAQTVDDFSPIKIPAVTSKPLMEPSRTYARQSLAMNREFIQNEIVNYIDDEFYTFDENKCARDAGFILDAVRRDVQTGSNYNGKYVGKSYRIGTVGADKVIEDQLAETIEGIQYIQKDIESRLTGVALTRAQNSFSNIITAMVNDYTPDGTNYDYGTGNRGSNNINARQALQLNRAFLQAEATAWVAANYPSLSYDTAKCERDTGIMADAASYDIQHVTNTAMLDVAKLYFENGLSTLSADQRAPTAALYTHLGDVSRDLILKIDVTPSAGNTVIQNKVFGPVAAAIGNDMQDLWEIIATVIAADSLVDMPDDIEVFAGAVGAASYDYETEAALIGSRKDALQSTITDYLKTTFNYLEYDRDRCFRDTGYIIDAICHDIQYGGNSAMVNAAGLYFKNAVNLLPTDQRDATRMAFTRLGEIVEHVTRNELVPVEFGAKYTPTTAVYDNVTGEIVITIGQHELTTNDHVMLTEDGMTFTCDMDGNTTNHAAPQPHHPAYLRAIPVLATSSTTITVNVGPAAGGAHTFVSALPNAVSQVTGNLIKQDTSHLAARRTIATEAKNLAWIVANIADDNDEKGIPLEVPPFTNWIQSDLITAKEAIEDSIPALATSVINYITNNWNGISYPKQKCRRDIGILVDAISHDVNYSTNFASVQSAQFYFRNATSVLPYDQRQQTADLYTVMADVVSAVVQEQTPTNYGYTPTNVVYDPLTGMMTATIGSHNIEAGDFVTFDNLGITFSCPTSDVDPTPIEISHPRVGGDEWADGKPCRVEFVDGTTITMNAGPAGVDKAHTFVSATEGAIRKAIVTRQAQDISGAPATAVEGEYVADMIRIIEDAIRRDSIDGIPEIIEPDTSWIDNSLVWAGKEIDDNLDILADDVTNWINTTYNVLDYNKVKCRRDAGYLVDAFAYDLNYGGTSASKWNAAFYFWNNVYRIPEDQRVPTAKAYRKLGEIARDALLETLPGVSIKGESTTAVEAQHVYDLADIYYRSFLNKDEKDFGPTILPDFDWEDNKVFKFAREILIANRKKLSVETVRFVGQNYKFFDINLTRRDAGNLLQSVANDFKFQNIVTGQDGSQTSTRTYAAAFFDYNGKHVFPVFNPTTPGLSFQGTLNGLGALSNVTGQKPNHAYIVSTDYAGNRYDGTIYYWDGTAWQTDGANNVDLLVSFYQAWTRMKTFIKTNYTPDIDHDAMIDGLFDDVLRASVLRPSVLTFGSLVESIAHQFNGASAGVNRNALPINFRNLGLPISAIASVLSEDGGRVRWSGADELNNQYFARGLRINGRTGRIEGRPFTSSVRKLARRASNSRAVV